MEVFSAPFVSLRRIGKDKVNKDTRRRLPLQGSGENLSSELLPFVECEDKNNPHSHTYLGHTEELDFIPGRKSINPDNFLAWSEHKLLPTSILLHVIKINKKGGK